MLRLPSLWYPRYSNRGRVAEDEAGGLEGEAADEKRRKEIFDEFVHVWFGEPERSSLIMVNSLPRHNNLQFLQFF